MCAFALAIPPRNAERVARRVDAQFEQGLLGEIRDLLAAGSGDRATFHRSCVQAGLEHLHGVRGDRDA